MIAPIGESGSDIRKRSDQILKHLITPAALECGYSEPVRADKISEPGMITTQIIQRILQVPLVIADLSGRNPNVYYELALRHAIRKPCIQIVAEQEKLPFDVAGFRTISVDYRDLDSVEEARIEMIGQIRAMDGRTDVDSPVATALDLESFKRSGDPEERITAQLFSAVTEIHSQLSTLSKRVDEALNVPTRRTDPLAAKPRFDSPGWIRIPDADLDETLTARLDKVLKGIHELQDQQPDTKKGRRKT